MKLSTRDLALQAIIAALYVALTFGLYSLSYGKEQLRVAEFLMILVLFNRKHAIGIIIGTFLANMIGAYGVIDMVIGTGATALACYLMTLKQPRLLAYIWPTVINAVVIGAMLATIDKTPFVVNAVSVGFSELLVTTLPFIVVGSSILKNKLLNEILV